MFWLFGFRGREGVRVNPNIVRIVMHIGIYGRCLSGFVFYKMCAYLY